MPQTPRLTCCLSFDFDGMAGWIGAFGSDNPSMISRGEFGAVALPRVLELLHDFDIASTFFVPGTTALDYPDLVQRISGEGHEVAHHGWAHENPSDFDRDGERRNLELGINALERVTGRRPIGYRSPAWDLSTNSLDLLLEGEFVYDSSCMAADFYPYYLRKGDRWSKTDPYFFGELCQLIEIPVTWGLDDAPIFEFVPGFLQGFAAPSAVEEIWQGDFDYACGKCPGGVYTLTLHPHVIGRGHRMLMLERLLNHFRSHSGVVFETMESFIGRWKAQNPLEEWRSQNPIQARAGRPGDQIGR